MKNRCKLTLWHLWSTVHRTLGTTALIGVLLGVPPAGAVGAVLPEILRR